MVRCAQFSYRKSAFHEAGAQATPFASVWLKPDPADESGHMVMDRVAGSAYFRFCSRSSLPFDGFFIEMRPFCLLYSAFEPFGLFFLASIYYYDRLS